MDEKSNAWGESMIWGPFMGVIHLVKKQKIVRGKDDWIGVNS